jgi:ABC-type dipeptide/oligopeptide/nickel transport system ATPase component
MSTPRVLEVSDLRVAYDETEILHGIDLAVSPGEIVGLVGESGSGKTTLGTAILGLLPVGASTRGAIAVDGTDLTTLGREALRRRRGPEIGAIFQDAQASLDPACTIGSQFREMLRAHRSISRKAADAEAERWLTQVGIPSPRARLKAYPHELSGGMAQRVAIGMALSFEPKLVIADEPTSALDVTVQVQVLDLLRDLVRTHEATLLLITHDLGIVAQLCSRACVMADGRIVEDRPVGDLFARPSHEQTRRLLDTRPGHRPAAPPPPAVMPSAVEAAR